MRVLLWHGYLLRGSGSNIYTSNLARSWRAAGHDVLLLCQETDVGQLDFIDAHGDFDSGNEVWSLEPAAAGPAAGRCRLVRPHIGELLPLYVYDVYEGFTAKRYVDLTDHELEAYTQRNVRALAAAIEAHRPDAIITGHEVMGPYIAKLACEPAGRTYLAKLHGSALEYAVKLQDRYLRYAQEGLGAAKIVVGGSEYMIEVASSVIPGWEDKACVVNPGCDIELFRPNEGAGSKDPVAGFVGKLMAAKGVHNLLAALGLTSTKGLKAVIVGYGGFEAGLRSLAAALEAGDIDAALDVAGRGEDAPLERLHDFLTANADGAYLERSAAVPVRWPGRLEHGPLSRTMPAWDVLVVPSVVPEAFGMVAAEAAACGVLPIVPNHSGIGEAGAAVEKAIGRPGLLTFDAARPIEGIAAAVDAVLAVSVAERRAMGQAAAALARDRWSWEHVAARLLDLAAS